MNARATTSIPDVTTRRRTAVTPEGAASPTSALLPGAAVLRKASCSCGGGCPGCQSAGGLKISEPHDPAEIEADRLADHVMRMPAGDTSALVHTPTTSHGHFEADEIHRKCDACEEEELEEPVMRKEANLAADAQPPEPPPASGDKPPSINSVITSGGTPLDPETRGFFEPRFGIDLSHVRVHKGADAESSARSINARAYTLGSDIVFGGAYLPASESGRHLLAHELAHVAQQPNTVAVDRSALSSATSADSRTIYRATEGLDDDLFESPLQGSGEQQTGGGGETKSGGCPKVPTKLGDLLPEPSCPTATHIGTNEVARINFCLDSDRPISPADLKQIAGIVSRNHPKTRFLIHGYASPEGNKKYNFNLACHRANRIADEFFKAIRTQVLARIGSFGDPGRTNEAVGTEFLARVETAAQGPTNKFGKPEENRLAIVYAQIPGATADEEPSCEDAHGKIGDIKPELAPDLDTVNLNGSTPGEHLAHFRFCKDSDVLKGMTPADVRKFAHAQASKAIFVVHGFASPEGDAEYNRRLSHHRALRIARELINAGVRPEQVREVSAIGETNKFGNDDANRVAVVQAQGGAVDEFEDSKHEAKTETQKQAVINEARGRLMAGQYNLKADAYISFWTCGRTRTVSQAVERLTIRPRNTDERETLPDRANGAEEGEGANTVIVSNVALRADNGIECTMGRLIDMAFHHSEIGNPDLGGNFDFRHSAGLHLIHLAGFGPCLGRDANPTVQIGNQKGGIDKPVEDDPRKNTRIPPCAEAPEPTRLHFPTEGAAKREVPAFNLVGRPSYQPRTGKIKSDLDTEKRGQDSAVVTVSPEGDILTASAEVQLSGQPSTFSDYEIGFVQAVLADETQADYVSGNHVIQQLPTPIRMAHLAGEIPVPAPWTTLDAMKRPDASGNVKIKTFGIGLNSRLAVTLRSLGTDLPNSGLAEFEHASEIAVWLIARRVGAPLDRFSIHFIDGVQYSVTQRGEAQSRRVKGEIDRRELPQEKELFVLSGGFHSAKPSDIPADIALIQLKGATSADIGLQNQVKTITAADAAPGDGMDKNELAAALADILDNLILFDNDDDAKKGAPGTKMPRLGYDFIPLTISIPFVRKTGRIETPFPKRIVTEVKGPGLGFDAGEHLARALEFRIHDRSFEGKGRDIVVRPSIIPANEETGKMEETGKVVVGLPPLPRKPDAPAAEESNLVKRPGVLKDMANAWACTVHTDRRPEEFGPNAIEFGAAYTMDRFKKLTVTPPDRLKSGKISADEEVREMDLPCPNVPGGVRLGAFHTHPEPQIPPQPSDADVKYTKNCDSEQHYIVTDNRVFRFFVDEKKGDVKVVDLNITLSGGQCHEVDLEELRKQVKDL